MHAATITKNAACPSPTFTHFISVPLRVFALISVVCGDEHAAAITSYVIPADARNATPRRCVAEVPTGMSAADRGLLRDPRSALEPDVPARRKPESVLAADAAGGCRVQRGYGCVRGADA